MPTAFLLALHADEQTVEAPNDIEEELTDNSSLDTPHGCTEVELDRRTGSRHWLARMRPMPISTLLRPQFCAADRH